MILASVLVNYNNHFSNAWSQWDFKKIIYDIFIQQ